MSELNVIGDFDRLALQVLGSIENVASLKTKLIKIAEDGTITADEVEDFQSVLDALERIASNATSLKIWAEKNIKQKAKANKTY